MSKKGKLPLAAGGFLIVFGGIADALKVGLDILLGIGVILDPVLISPVTWMVFWITLNHNNIPMMSGRRGAAGWVNLAVAECPGVDVVPDWITYAIYLTMVHGDFGSDDDIVSHMQGIIR